jgi:CofH subfamily radical SAM domain protein
MLDQFNVQELMSMADSLTDYQIGNTVTFAVSYNINYSNYCVASCPICAFYVPAKIKGKTDKGYELTVEDVKKELEIAKAYDPTEIHIVGGFNPYLPLEYYENIFRTVREYMPKATLKALTIPEIDFIARTTGNSIKETVSRLREAGLEAHTGGGAEIFDQEIRKVMSTPEKISGEKWLEDAKIIHEMGIKGNSTMTYGHVEKWSHIIDHMVRLRDLQAETGGFLSFIPLKFSPENTPLLKMGKVKGPASGEKDLKVISLARIVMGNWMKNISVYWVALGKGIGQMALTGGGNDLVGTALSEKIFGATNRNDITTVEELGRMVSEIGKIPAKRDTFYNLRGYF